MHVKLVTKPTKARMKNIIFILVSVFTLSCSTSQREINKTGNAEDRGLFSFLTGKTEQPPPRELLPIEYVRWVEDSRNGLCVREQRGEYIYELQYQPLEYLVALQERKEELEKKRMEEEMEKRKHLEYLTLKISTIRGKGISSDKEVEIADKELYLLSGMQKDIIMLDGNDSIQCAMFHMELSNNFLPYDQCLLAFEKPENSRKDLKILFRTDQYDQGVVLLEIKRNNINKAPKCKVNE